MSFHIQSAVEDDAEVTDFVLWYNELIFKYRSRSDMMTFASCLHVFSQRNSVFNLSRLDDIHMFMSKHMPGGDWQHS